MTKNLLVCRQCGLSKSQEEFYPHPTNLSGRKGQCKKCVNHTRAEKRKQISDSGVCISCKKPKIGNAQRCKTCSIKYQEYNLKSAKGYKSKLFELYGNKCACCGESRHVFLTIDHLNNDGKIDRANHKRTCHGYYRKLFKKGKQSDITLMCWNCNCGRSKNGNVCPHVQERFIDALLGYDSEGKELTFKVHNNGSNFN